jgi:hypothetical protein
MMGRKCFFAALAAGFLVCTTARGAVTFTNIADTNTTAPGQSVKFSQFDLPSLSGNDLSFLAFYSGGFGEYTSTVSPTTTSKLIDTGNNIGTHGAVEGLGNNGGVTGSTVTIRALYSGGEGLYKGTVGTAGVSKIIETGTLAPGQTTAFSSFNDVKPSGTNVAFEGFYNSGNGSGIYSSTLTGTSLTKIVDFTSTAPGQGAFTEFNRPDISGTHVVFWGKASTDGIYAGTVGTAGATKIADHTDTVGTHSFSGFDNAPSVSGTEVTFEGVFGQSSGIYSATIGSTGITKIAESGDAAPGTGTTFAAVQDPSTNGQNVAFLGSYIVAGVSKTGIFLDSDGTITSVIKAGDPLFGGVLRSLFPSNSAYDGYRVGFQYSLTNGTTGIAVADLPEPESISLLTIGVVSALARRRGRC